MQIQAGPVAAQYQQNPQYGLSGAYNILGHGNRPQVSAGGTVNFTPTASGPQGMADQGAASGRTMNGEYGTYGNAVQHGRAGIKNLKPWTEPGIAAHDMQAALSGAMGQDAQAQAYANYSESPGQQWLREQGEQAVMRNAAALGGLGGGNVMKELTRYGQGLASQDFQNYFNRAGDVANRGMQGAGLQTGLYDTMSNAATQRGNQLAQIQAAGLSAAGSAAAAQIAADAALKRDAAQYAYDAGNRIGGNVSNTSSSLASLINSQGTGLSNLYGTNTGNLAGLLTGGGQTVGQNTGNWANVLANTRIGSGSQVAGLPGLPNVAQNNAMGNAGNFLGGFSSLMGAMGGGGGGSAVGTSTYPAMSQMVGF